MFDRKLSVASALLASLVLPARAQDTHYTITNVSHDVPGTAYGVAGLSDTGYVTGYIDLAGAGTGLSGFRWSSRGLVMPEPPLGVNWLAFNTVDVNDSGTVVGEFGATSSSSMNRGFRWKSGAATELLNPLGLPAFPTAINDKGWVVGYSGFQTGVSTGAIQWDPQSNPSYVADLTQALDLNASGQVVGVRYDAADVARAFLYDQGALTPLGTLDPLAQGHVFPRAINAHGVVVGTSSINGEEHAFRWTAAGGMTELPGLGIHAFPFDVAALDVNDGGWVVGYAPNLNGITPVVWTPDGAVQELEPLIPDVGQGKNWPSVLAFRINAAGQISGFAAHVPSNYQPRTVLLTPTTITAGALVPSAAGTVNTLAVTGAEPDTAVFLAAALDDPLDRGYTTLSGCAPLGLAMETPRIVATAVTDGAGQADFAWEIPAGLAGATFRLQAFQRGSCALSNVVRATF